MTTDMQRYENGPAVGPLFSPSAADRAKATSANELAPRPAGDIQETLLLAEHLAKSGYFADARTASQAVVKILTGRELGFPTIASMVGVHIIEGKPSIGAHLMAAAIKRSDRYDFRVIERTRARCELEFLERPKGGGPLSPVGRMSMTMQEAIDTGLATKSGGAGGALKSNWSRSADDMLFARCISKGYRTYCADLSAGCLAYTPDELDHGEAPEPLPAVVVNVPQTAPPPALPAPSDAPPDRLSQENEVELSRLIREAVADPQKVLAHYGVKFLHQLSRAQFTDCKKVLSERIAKAAPPPADNAAAVVAVKGNIDRALEQLGVTSEQWLAGLQRQFGHQDASKLGLADLKALEARIEAKLASKAGAAS
jgi:hypothetical protein